MIERSIAPKDATRRRSRMQDTPDSYGWISIALHWISAAVIITLWFVGDSIKAADTAGERLSQIQLHVSIALCAYPLLWFRIWWRLRRRHPRLEEQGPIDRRLSQSNHYVLLLAIATMLLSGPLMVWASGGVLSVFDWLYIPAPFGANSELHALLLRIHQGSALLIAIATTMHFLGAMKHMMFDDDDVFIRMLAPLRRKPPE